MSTFYAFYPPSGGAANASVGPNGTPIPSSSTLVAGENPSGNQQPLQTTADGSLIVSQDTTSSPFHTEDAADGTVGAVGPAIAIQVGMKAQGSGFLTVPTVDSLGNVAITIAGQQLPQVDTQDVASSGTGSPIPGYAMQMGAEDSSGNLQPLMRDDNGYLQTVDEASTRIGSGPGTNVMLAGAINPSTQAAYLLVDASGNLKIATESSVLPTGAATSANQTSEIALLTSIAGTQTSGGQQTQIVQGGNTATIDSSGQLNTTVRDTTTTGNITSNQSVTAACQSRSSAGIAITGTWTGTVVLEGSVDGINFVPVSGAVLAGGLISTSFSANNTIQANISGLQSIRIRGNTVTSGTASITIECNATAGAVILSESLPQGGNTIGNVGQSGVWTVTATSVGTASANAPVYNDYTSTNITTSAYTQLVASTSSAINSIHIFDSSGQTMILAVGAPGSEVNQVYVQPGGDTFTLRIPAGSRISYKALTANATAGYLIMSFLE